MIKVKCAALNHKKHVLKCNTHTYTHTRTQRDTHTHTQCTWGTASASAARALTSSVGRSRAAPVLPGVCPRFAATPLGVCVCVCECCLYPRCIVQQQQHTQKKKEKKKKERMSPSVRRSAAPRCSAGCLRALRTSPSARWFGTWHSASLSPSLSPSLSLSLAELPARLLRTRLAHRVATFFFSSSLFFSPDAAPPPFYFFTWSRPHKPYSAPHLPLSATAGAVSLQGWGGAGLAVTATVRKNKVVFILQRGSWGSLGVEIGLKVFFNSLDQGVKLIFIMAAQHCINYSQTHC